MHTLKMEIVKIIYYFGNYNTKLMEYTTLPNLIIYLSNIIAKWQPLILLSILCNVIAI